MNASLAPDMRDQIVQELHARTTSPGFHILSSDYLSRLKGQESADPCTLSVYLALTPEMRQGDAWQIALKDLTRQTLKHSVNGQQAAAQEAFAQVEEALRRGLPRTGRGVAVFANPKTNLFEQVGVSLPLPNMAMLAKRPYIRPLARLRDEHDRFGIVLLSMRRARFFLSQIGLVEEVLDLVGEDVGTWDYASKDDRQDKRTQLQHEFAGRIAEATTLMAETLGIRHILYSAPTDMEAPFVDALDQKTRGMLAGNFACDTNASTADLLSRVEPLQRAVEAREERETLDALEAQRTKRAAVGLDETLDLLNQQRVLTLIVDDRFRVPGGRSHETDMLTAQTEGTLAHTGEAIDPVEDLVDAMLERALDQGASLELIRSEDAQARMDTLGPVAALLRY